jgi:DNA repair protein RadA/Sms
VLANLHVETCINDVLMLPGFLTQTVLNHNGVYHGVSMVVIDSIQGPGLSANDFERWQALLQATALTRAARVVTLLICHVTKSGEIAGPKALQHAVDCTILIRKASTRRQFTVLKNRFGPETARPMQLELDTTTVTLRPCPHAETLTSVVAMLPGDESLHRRTCVADRATSWNSPQKCRATIAWPLNGEIRTVSQSAS